MQDVEGAEVTHAEEGTEETPTEGDIEIMLIREVDKASGMLPE